jgi:hypothetical protein
LESPKKATTYHRDRLGHDPVKKPTMLRERKQQSYCTVDY